MELTGTYMGLSESLPVSESDLLYADPLDEISEMLGKAKVGLITDANGPNEDPMTWKDGKADENGCGAWHGGIGEDTVPFCNELLARVGMEPLIVVDGDIKAAFDIDGVNHYALCELDQAEWKLEHGD